MLKILTVPNKILIAPSIEVENIDKQLKKLMVDMEKVLVVQDDPPGVGIAAPQVGHNLRFFIMKTKPSAPTLTIINPKIIGKNKAFASYSNKSKAARKKGKESSLEGCLSVPRIWAPVHRSSKVTIEYQTLEGEKKKQTFSGLEAVVVQHEIDHLDGIIFTQRALEQHVPIYREEGEDLKRIEF